MTDKELAIGALIRKRRRDQNLSQEKLSKLSGVSVVSISRIESSKQNPSVDLISKLSEALGISMFDLIKEAGMNQASSPDGPQGDLQLRKVPLLSYVQAGEWTEHTDGDFPAGYAEEYVELPVKGERVFALRIRGDSMLPEFREGEIIAVDPEREVLQGQYGVVKNLDTNETTVKSIEFYDDLVILRPLNPEFRPIKITNGEKHFRIIGKVVMKAKKYS